MMFYKIFLVFVGSGIGGVLRYLISLGISTIIERDFPFGTLAVNVLGCIIIGSVILLTDRLIINSDFKFLLAIGFCGGFTTFSSLSYETLTLIQDKEYLYAGLNIIISVILGLAGVWLGMIIIKLLNS